MRAVATPAPTPTGAKLESVTNHHVPQEPTEPITTYDRIANKLASSGVQSEEVQTNVKQGALIGGCVCFVVAAICLIAPFPTFFLWIPLAVAAFILSIVAMSQRRVFGGLCLLLLTVIGVPILWAYGVHEFGKTFSEALTGYEQRKSAHESTPSLKTASESPVTDKSTMPGQPAPGAEASSAIPTAPGASSIQTDTKTSLEQPTALDVKGGFREYRLGMKKQEVTSTLF